MNINKGIVGLINLGNTCYINSILQCLFNTPIFKDKFLFSDIEIILYNNIINNIEKINKNNILQYINKLNRILKNNTLFNIDKTLSEIEIINIINLIDNDVIKHALNTYAKHRINKDNIESITKHINNTLSYELSKLFENVWSGNNTILNPKSFINLLYKEISKYQKNFQIHEHQDSSEALESIFTCIDEQLERNINISYNFINNDYYPIFDLMDSLDEIECFNLEKIYDNIYELYTVKKALDNYYKKNFSIVVELFQSLELYTLTCSACLYNNYNACTRNIYPLSINKNKVSTIYDCFDEYFKTEILDEDNKRFCYNCKIKTDSLKKLVIWIPPLIFIIQLKRFECDLEGNIKKLTNLIDFPIYNLNINKYMSDLSSQTGQYIYDLYAISNHIGNINNGHYYSFIKSLSNSNWYIVDDNNINEINETDIITSNAYILFYKLKNI